MSVESLNEETVEAGKEACVNEKLHVSHRLLIEPIRHSGQQIIFNPVTGLVDVATDHEVEELRRLERSGTAESNSSLAAHLLERKLAYRHSSLEDDEFESRVAAAQRRFSANAPNVYTVCPTLACNLGCAYCFEGDSLLEKPQGVMSPAQTDKLFAAIDALEHEREARQADSLASGSFSPACISLFGGEPLLPSTRSCVASVMRYAAGRNMTLAATTNGVNVFRYGDLLSEFADFIDSLQITLDGPRTMHDSRRHRLGGQGTFDEIVRGIDLLVELGIAVNLRVNLDTKNLPTLPELCDFVKAKGWHEENGVRMIVAPVTVHAPKPQSASFGNGTAGNTGSGCASAQYESALDELAMHKSLIDLAREHPIVSEICSFAHLRHLEHLSSLFGQGENQTRLRRRTDKEPGPRYWYCEQGTGQQYVFTPDGHVYTCTEAVGKVRHAIGRFDPQLDLWKQQVNRWLGRTVLSHPKCRTCPISTLCGGGCHFAARERTIVQNGAEGSSELLQIKVGGRRDSLRQEPQQPENVEPYCAAAEQIVRDYLQTAGQKLLAA